MLKIGGFLVNIQTTDISHIDGYNTAIIVCVVNIKIVSYQDYFKMKSDLHRDYDHIVSVDEDLNVSVEKTWGLLHINKIERAIRGEKQRHLLITPPLSDPDGPRPGWEELRWM